MTEALSDNSLVHPVDQDSISPPTAIEDDVPDAGYRLCIPMKEAFLTRALNSENSRRSRRSHGVSYPYPCFELGRAKPQYLEQLNVTDWNALGRDINDARLVRLVWANRITTFIFIFLAAIVVVSSLDPGLMYFTLLICVLAMTSVIVQNWMAMRYFRKTTIPALHKVVSEWKEKLYGQPSSVYRLELVVEKKLVCCGCESSPLVYLLFQRSSTPP
jgi:hypothetical protein